MSFWERRENRVVTGVQHPYQHDLSDLYYTNPALPGGMTNPREVLDYIVAMMYPNYIGTYATPAALPVAPAANSYALVTDDGDGKSAGYIYQTLDGVSQWMKRYDVDWSMEGILSETVNRTQYMYVHKYGMTDTDGSGNAITGDLAGQSIFGGDQTGQNLTLNANSADLTGYVQTTNDFRPTSDNSILLGTLTKRWSEVNSVSALIGDISISTGSIDAAGGIIDFDATDLNGTGSATFDGGFFAGNLELTTSGILQASGDLVINVSAGDTLINSYLETYKLTVLDTNVIGAGSLVIESLNPNPSISSSSGTIGITSILSSNSNIVTTANSSAATVTGTTKVTSPLFEASTMNYTSTVEGHVFNAPDTKTFDFKINGSSYLEVSQSGIVSQSQYFRINNASSYIAATSFKDYTGAFTGFDIGPGNANVSFYGRAMPISESPTRQLGSTAARWHSLYLSSAIGDGTNTISMATLMSLRDINVGVAANMSIFWDGTKWVASYADLEVDHGNIQGLADDDHTQYALLAGRAGGQTLNGGTAASENLTFSSTAHATKGNIVTDSILRGSVDNTIDLGTASYTFKDVYTKGQFYGLRLENVGATPGFSASSVGRLYWNTATSRLQIDSGLAILELDPLASGANQYLSNLAGPTAINQNLIFDKGSFALIKTKDDNTADTQALYVATGIADGFNSGILSLQSGDSLTSGNTGDVNILSGNATSGNSGDINIIVGTASGTRGTIYLEALYGDFVFQQSLTITTVTGIFVGYKNISNLADPVASDDASTKAYVDYGLNAAVASKSADATLSAAEKTILVNASGANRTMTLPAAASNSGRVYHIKKIDSSANTVTVDGNASELIDGSTTYVLTVQYQSITIVCDGSAWYII